MSKINKIKAMLQNVLAQFAKMSTDKGLLSYAEDEIAVGVSVMIVDEEGNETKPEDGEYKADDGTVYVIEDGKVVEIREVETEEPSEEPQAEELKKQASSFHRMIAAFESYEEKEQKMVDAIRAMGIEAYLVEAGDDYVIVDVWTGEDYALWKYEISWNEGEPVIGEGIEVKPAFVPAEEEAPAEPIDAPAEENFEEEEETDPKDEKIANLEAEVARLEQENGELKERIKELEEKPAASSAEEEFEKANTIKPTGNKRLDKLSRILQAK